MNNRLCVSALLLIILVLLNGCNPFSSGNPFVQNEKLSLELLVSAKIELVETEQDLNDNENTRKSVVLDREQALALIGTINLGKPKKRTKLATERPFHIISFNFQGTPEKVYYARKDYVKTSGPASGTNTVWTLPQPGIAYFTKQVK